MSLLALLAAARNREPGEPIPLPGDRPKSTLVAPYNAPNYITFPTPYALSLIHI